MKQLCLIAIFLGATMSVLGQAKAITKEQYDAANEDARTKVGAMLRRVVSEETLYKSGKVDSTKTLITETFPNGDNRWNLVRKRDGQIFEKLQLIYLGKYEYRKEGDNGWKKRCVKDCSSSELSGMGFGISGSELPKVQEFLMSDATVSGQKATVYVFYRVYDFGKTLNFYKSKIWIGTDGLILRQETTTSDVFPENQTSSQTISYEYNPKNVAPLEAPVK